MRRRRRPGPRWTALLGTIGVLATLALTAGAGLARLAPQESATRLGEWDVVRTYQAALHAIERDLPAAGADAEHGRPKLVYADGDSIVLDAGDAAREREPVTLFFAPDSTTPREDDYVLCRRAGGEPVRVVARRLLRTPGQAFFRYQEIAVSDASIAHVRWVPEVELPLLRSGAPAPARIDRVLGVLVSFTASDGLPEGLGWRRPVRRFIRLAEVRRATPAGPSAGRPDITS
jgi:hypothetical protein